MNVPGAHPQPMVNNVQAAAARDAMAARLAERRRKLLADCKAIPGNNVIVRERRGSRWVQVPDKAYPDSQRRCYIAFELQESGRLTTYGENDVQEYLLDRLAMDPGPFPEYFPHSFGDPDFEPEMGEVSYDGYAPTPAIHPQDGLP